MEIKSVHPIPVNLFRFFLFLLFLTPSFLQAEVRIDIIVPQLRDGMEELEALLAENVGDAALEIEKYVNDFLEKPELTRAFGSATGLTASLPAVGLQPLASSWSFSLGSYASLYSYTLRFDLLSDRLSSLDPEDDFEFGGSVRIINGSFTAPLERVLPRLSLFASVAYADVESDYFFLKDFYLQSSLGYGIFDDREYRSGFKWSPLYLQSGAGFAYHSIGAFIPLGEITREFEADPDGAGPLPPQDVSILLDPDLGIGMQSAIGVLTFSLSTGLSLFDTFHVYAGTGCTVAFGRTDIVLTGDNEVAVLGYLGELVEEPGSVNVGGSVEGSAPHPFTGYLFTGVQLDISKMFIAVPLLFLPGRGLSGGISLGVRL